ncbi:MAG: hypothetical protein E6G78_21775, partial [Alphaproteobacteria bacterium]
MKNLPAGGDPAGRPAGRNERARVHQSGPSHVMLPLRRSAGVNSSRGDATTMRARRSSSKPAALHIGVTALFTFPPVHRVPSFAANIPQANPARTPMKMIAIATVIALALGGAPPGYAQSYPSHPITIIVPFPAGGPTDTLARILSERMRVSLGQPVIIETVTGAGASIGVARAAQAAPDGYTLSIGNWTSHVGAGAMYPAVHDAVLELQPVSRISATPLMIVGKNALPPKNAQELIAWLKANPAKASAATVGSGSGAHICLLYFQQKTGTSFQFVPYR